MYAKSLYYEKEIDVKHSKTHIELYTGKEWVEFDATWNLLLRDQEKKISKFTMVR